MLNPRIQNEKPINFLFHTSPPLYHASQQLHNTCPTKTTKHHWSKNYCNIAISNNLQKNKAHTHQKKAQ